MKQRIKQLILSLALVMGLTTSFVLVPAVSAVNPIGDQCASNPDSTICQHQGDDIGTVIKTVVNVLLFIVGAISVIMIIVAGIRYAASGGDSTAVTGAKNTILYSVVGLVVAFLAYAIVNWVLVLFK